MLGGIDSAVLQEGQGRYVKIEWSGGTDVGLLRCWMLRASPKARVFRLRGPSGSIRGADRWAGGCRCSRWLGR
jgi:hypothetical protein